MSDETPLDLKQIGDALYGALRVNLDRLPQMKGKGKERDPSKVDMAVRILAEAVGKNLIRSGITFHRGPIEGMHSNG